MILKKAPVMEEVEEYIFKSSTYCNSDGTYPEINTMVIPDDVLEGKMFINPNINKDIIEKIHGQLYISKFHKDNIPIIEH